MASEQKKQLGVHVKKVILFHGTFFGVHCPHMTSSSMYEGVNGKKSVST